MAWVDATILQNAIGAAQVTALGLDTGASLTQYELQARAKVTSAAKRAGYSGFTATLDTSTDAAALDAAFLQQMTMALIIRSALGLKKGIQLSPATTAVLDDGMAMLEAFFAKSLPMPSTTPNTLDGVGGSQFNTDPSFVNQVTSPVFQLRKTGF